MFDLIYNVVGLVLSTPNLIPTILSTFHSTGD